MKQETGRGGELALWRSSPNGVFKNGGPVLDLHGSMANLRVALTSWVCPKSASPELGGEEQVMHLHKLDVHQICG